VPCSHKGIGERNRNIVPKGGTDRGTSQRLVGFVPLVPPLFVYGAPEACQAKCEKANTPKEAEACLTKERPKP
jgi:hypothetical protein